MTNKITEEVQEDLASHAVGYKNPAHRPRYWTEDKIRELADEMVEWSERSDSIILSEFVTNKNMSPSITHKLCGYSSYFRGAYKVAKSKVGAKRERGAIEKTLDSKVYMFTARMYDKDLDKHLGEQLEKDELAKAQAKIKALKKELNHKGEILDYINAQKELDAVTK